MRALQVPDRPISLDIADWYERKEVHRFFSSGQNFNPLPVDPDYRSRFVELLAGFSQSANVDELVSDLADIERNVPDVTQRERLIQARIGQGRFRADVTRMWGKGESCSLTGIDVPELLIASHVKPWRESNNFERLDSANGLLLATHVDRLFDRFLLSFEVERGDWQVVISPRVRKAAAALGVKAGMKLRSSMLTPAQTQRLQEYMAGHFLKFDERNAQYAATA